MVKKRKVRKKENLKQWKKGINNDKLLNSAEYSRNMRGGIRL